MSSKVEAYFIIHTIDLAVKESEWIKCGLRCREKKDMNGEIRANIWSDYHVCKRKLSNHALTPLYTEEFLFPRIKVICL